MRYLVKVSWGQLRAGTTIGANDAAGCNMAMLLARGVLVPAVKPSKSKTKPAKPVASADEPEEQ